MGDSADGCPGKRREAGPNRSTTPELLGHAIERLVKAHRNRRLDDEASTNPPSTALRVVWRCKRKATHIALREKTLNRGLAGDTMRVEGSYPWRRTGMGGALTPGPLIQKATKEGIQWAHAPKKNVPSSGRKDACHYSVQWSFYSMACALLCAGKSMLYALALSNRKSPFQLQFLDALVV